MASSMKIIRFFIKAHKAINGDQERSGFRSFASSFLKEDEGFSKQSHYPCVDALFFNKQNFFRWNSIINKLNNNDGPIMLLDSPHVSLSPRIWFFGLNKL